jgi:arginyl-tRNA synthetase
MDPIVEMGLEKKVFSVGEGGAIVAEFSDEKLPTTIVKRSDGATVYLTRDLANLKYRLDNYDPAKILYVVDVAQKLHFEQVRAISQNLNFIPKDDTIFAHVIFGRMSFADGNMSTRKGNIIELNDVLEEGISRSLAVIKEKKAELTESETAAVSRKVGIGCIKYAILCQNRTTNIVFSWDKVINFEGNSAAYLQYTYARTSSIGREAANLGLTNTFSDQGQQPELNDHERQLIAKLIKFPETLYEATHEQKPHLIADYLFKLAHQFNAFYTNCPVLKAEHNTRDFRLALTSHVAETIKTGLDLLGGIEVPEKM